ncbi:effector-associated constant component EACC1 [Streptomyces sp. IB201691-2A2]|uniref:effector-associated constant component EACC1 n=1 Tax=Streptomyces sp. IB201691-2A2 TaxID=2561920 RepID=UPI0028C4BFAF|nr:tetratricopeptide repeat protein [Streptomyces sp. IB201691-2A2]
MPPDQDDVPSTAPYSIEPEPGRVREPYYSRLVMIARTMDPVRAGSRFDHLGTGFLLGPRMVLTAAHVLNRHGLSGNVKVRNRLRTVTADGWVNCRVLWTHDSYDAALLLTEDDLAEVADDRHFSDPRWAQLTGDEPLSPCHITGVIVANETSPRASGHLAGTLHPSTQPDTSYEFEPSLPLAQPHNSKSFARSMSGAPVFYGKFLLGFVIAMRNDRSGRPRFAVTGIDTLANDRGFTKACSPYMRQVPLLHPLPVAPSAPTGDGHASGGPAGRQPPRVFISYAHEDDTSVHTEQVRSLGELLRAEGIDVRLDQLDAEAPRDWTAWMRQGMETADVILVIASPAYKRRAENPEADPSVGVAFEARLLRNELAHAPTNESQRILPVLLPGSTSKDLPSFLRPLRPLVISPITRTGADQLLHRLTQGSSAEDRTDPAEQAARRFTALAEHSWRAGHRAEALATADHAIEIYRRLASNNPVDYQPPLATALITQSDRLAGTGRSDSALHAAHEAVDISESQAQSDPDVFRPTLAMALSTLSNRLAETGERKQALAAAERAVMVRQQLANTGPIPRTYDLARSLSNLSNRLADLGRRQEALSTINDAVALCRQAAETNPDTFLPGFATMLNNQGTALREAGQPTEAVNVIEEAVLVCRQLAQTDPDTFFLTLASTLLNLGSALSELDRHGEALSTTKEAVTFYRQLAETSPDTPSPRLADALHNLSLRLSEFGRSAEAFTTIDEAIAIRRHLVATNPDPFLPDLAQSLSAAAWLRTSQRQDLDTALDEANEAVEIFRRLEEQLPTVFTSDLQQAQSVQAAALDGLGRSDEADQIRSQTPPPHRNAMDVRIQTEHGDPEELQSLLQQLEEEPTLRGQARIVPVAPKGALGTAALIALEVAVPGGPVLVPLVVALTAWLRRRKARTAVEITTADGRQVTVSTQQPDRVRAALESLLGQED